jgi:AcrR family transcriptional regulator
MNFVANLRAETDAPASLRAQSKLKTRRRVLESARNLFMERGYEAATIRDIASEAGLSTGAVFASFVDKTDLFNAVMAEDFQRQLGVMRQAVRAEDKTEDALLAIFEAGYRFHGAQLPLLQAAVSLSWSSGLGGAFGERPTYDLALPALVEVLARGAAGGEIKAGGDQSLAAELLWDAYVANFRRALFDGWTIERLAERMRAQIRLILAGLA